MNNDTNELQNYLLEIADKSLKGDISWNQPNPSSYQWVKASKTENFVITIQRAGLPRSKMSGVIFNELERETYLFQVQDRLTKQTVISLSSKERPEMSSNLKRIYNSAEKGMDLRTTNVLRKLLGK
jgi:hypothetical protein